MGTEIHLCNVAEAEQIGCKRHVAERYPEFVAQKLEPPTSGFFEKDRMDDISIQNVHQIRIPMDPRDFDRLAILKEFNDCFRGIDTIPISRDVLVDVNSAIQKKLHLVPNPYSKYGEEPEYIPVAPETMECLNRAMDTILYNGAYNDDRLVVYPIKTSIVVFMGFPVLYVDGQTTIEKGKAKKAFGYAMIDPRSCIRLQVNPMREDLRVG